MSYILVTIISGHKYYVQNYKGQWLLNGLRDNAKSFLNEELAKEKRAGIKRQFKTDLHVQEVLPKS